MQALGRENGQTDKSLRLDGKPASPKWWVQGQWETIAKAKDKVGGIWGIASNIDLKNDEYSDTNPNQTK